MPDMLDYSTTYVEGAVPFLKWAGGKGQLLKQYKEFLPLRKQIRRYFEPFIGSAAVFFYLQPSNALLADSNKILIETYRVIQNDVDNLIRVLGNHKNDETYFYQVRALNPNQMSVVERAARFIYLNKTCYNGLYRENKKGEFNVPFGRYANPTICDPERLRTASRALQGVELSIADFEEATAGCDIGDFIYFDPPYIPITATSSFTSYNRDGFTVNDHVRLAETFHRLASKGCSVMLSNSSAPLVYDLYSGRGYTITEIEARRSINSNPNRRGPITELFISN
jgi:DNA adenine methylase